MSEKCKLEGAKPKGLIVRLELKNKELKEIAEVARKFSEKAYGELKWAMSDIQGAIDALSIHAGIDAEEAAK